MLRTLICLSLLLPIALLTGCGKSDNVPTAVRRAENTTSSPAGVPPQPEEDTKEFNVGDAESSIELVLEVDPESKQAGVSEEPILTAKKTVSQSTATVKEPVPASLWVRIHVQPHATFIERTVVVRGVLERDGQAIAAFQTVLGKYALERDLGDGSKRPQVFRVDILKDLPQRPASMLCFARAEILLAPKGTDEASIDPATLQADPADVSAKISNPLRVNFPAAAAAAAPAAPAPAAQ